MPKIGKDSDISVREGGADDGKADGKTSISAA